MDRNENLIAKTREKIRMNFWGFYKIDCFYRNKCRSTLADMRRKIKKRIALLQNDFIESINILFYFKKDRTFKIF